MGEQVVGANATPRIIDGRYVLTSDPPREGGMSTVQKAFDPQENRFCAIKRMKSSRMEELRWKESFNREYSALRDLSGHPNIVSLFDAGTDADGFYMVLEWVPTNLPDWLSHKGPLAWHDFYPQIGRPLLDAIAFAQSRGWIHRDIKPQNILITDEGVPKVSDYGIAKQLDRPALGITFSSFRSEPFAPPENDGGEWSNSRDCFSFAAVAVYCLSGQVPENYGALANCLSSLDQSAVPVSVLQSALSADPPERPPLASAFLADLDRFWDQTIGRHPTRMCHLQLGPECLQYLLWSLNVSDRRDVEKHILDELSEVEVGWQRAEKPGLPEDALRAFAVSSLYELYRVPGRRDTLVISRSIPLGAGDLEHQREMAFRTPLRFTFSAPKDSAQAAAALDELAIEIRAFEGGRRQEILIAQRERVFRVWNAFLRAKADLESRRENAIPFIDARVKDNYLILTTELSAPSEIIGQSRVIKLASDDYLFCDVVDVTLDNVTVSISSGAADRVPRRGSLELNTVAAERAIERQRRALDAVTYNRAASPRLKPLLVDPTSARAPIMVDVSHVDRQQFDEDKAEILSRALGLQDVLAIQGPPGTGKTRLIEEIIVQYLARHPDHRVLLSSQTHVALDNVIDRVRARHATMDIVRIGRADDQKISASCRDLLLDRKTNSWASEVRKKATAYLASWADKHGIDRQNIEIGMISERLNLLLASQRELREALRNANQRVALVEQQREAKLNATGSAESATIAQASMDAQRTTAELRNGLAQVTQAISEARAKLSAIGGYGAELAAENEPENLHDWAGLLLAGDSDHERCRELLELQEEWLLRVGRSSDFHAAILASAKVVAGTCIGMASVRGMAQVVYDLCIVDEASKATATEILVPMSRSRKWILVGDPAQLPPFFEDDSVTQLGDFDEAEVRETILDRFLKTLPDHSLGLLKSQHRMVKPIGDLISDTFYESRLNSPKLKPDVTLPGAFPKPLTWLSTADLPDRGETKRGQSFQNDAECRTIRDVLSKIDFVARKRKDVYEVAVIAGYVAQVKALQDVIRERSHEWSGLKVVCSTVDAFQGSEAEICIYSVTRSNDAGRLGFLREKPRLNVALSRGRSALIIVGDDVFCRSIEGLNPFQKILNFFDAHPTLCDRRAVQ